MSITDPELRRLAQWYPTQSAAEAAIEASEERLYETQEARETEATRRMNLRRLILVRAGK
jgi:hypothetical protein